MFSYKSEYEIILNDKNVGNVFIYSGIVKSKGIKKRIKRLKDSYKLLSFKK